MKAKGQEYQCTDGRLVLNLSDCELPVPQNVTPKKNITTLPVVNTTPQEPPRNYTTLRKKNTTSETPLFENGTGNYPDLNGWSVEEIVEGMSSYEARLNGQMAIPVKYDKTNQSLYYFGNDQSAKIFDPFWVGRVGFAGETKEYSVFNLRVNVLQNPTDFRKLVLAKRNDTKFKILYPDQWLEWDRINCSIEPSCRNINAVKCTTGNHVMYMWTHSTPGPTYTADTRYTMQAVDDKRASLTAFEKLYCTQV
jgi:hypothetical protein